MISWRIPVYVANSSAAFPAPNRRTNLAVWQYRTSPPSRPAIEGIPALSLDAISSTVAYGPEAMLVVLATAGAGALAKIEPITIAIVVLLVILVFSYRQVIEAYPDRGGCYAVSKANLGPHASHLATAASLVVDYVLTVAVSISAGVAALVSAFPGLADSLDLSLAFLVR